MGAFFAAFGGSPGCAKLGLLRRVRPPKRFREEGKQSNVAKKTKHQSGSSPAADPAALIHPPQPAATANQALGGAAKAAAEAKAAEFPHRWTFLTNHAHVLAVLYTQPGLVLRQVAGRVGITERAVQRIVQDLEEEGYIRRERLGRQNRYEVLTDRPLRHPIEAHRDIGDLLKLVMDEGSP